ncbi:hypothetical protein [Streptomyces sp. Root369]|uniref:hypothetical protein n=1 Tax=Streptomyces sp. Root369 TaxID=1736523 RepID=UPI00070CBF9C|nr:hypothetical protein [Streptomyces sp. Root369]KQW03651.1 hypothetical protein ASD08_43740 [Streptomyces sp. Root369]
MIVAHSDVSGLFDSTPELGSAALYPPAMPLGLTVFAAMLQLTVVCEGWPFKRWHSPGDWLSAMTLFVSVVVGARLFGGLITYAGTLTWTTSGAEGWASLSA